MILGDDAVGPTVAVPVLLVLATIGVEVEVPATAVGRRSIGEPVTGHCGFDARPPAPIGQAGLLPRTIVDGVVTPSLDTRNALGPNGSDGVHARIHYGQGRRWRRRPRRPRVRDARVRGQRRGHVRPLARRRTEQHERPGQRDHPHLTVRCTRQATLGVREFPVPRGSLWGRATQRSAGRSAEGPSRPESSSRATPPVALGRRAASGQRMVISASIRASSTTMRITMYHSTR